MIGDLTKLVKLFSWQFLQGGRIIRVHRNFYERKTMIFPFGLSLFCLFRRRSVCVLRMRLWKQRRRDNTLKRYCFVVIIIVGVRKLFACFTKANPYEKHEMRWNEPSKVLWFRSNYSVSTCCHCDFFHWNYLVHADNLRFSSLVKANSNVLYHWKHFFKN